MWKPVFAVVLALSALLAAGAGRASELTETENRWLKGVWPVVSFAKEQKLALDIVVQPQAAPGLPPLAMAFVNGRCKLVFSMRGNSEAQATLDRIDPELLAPVLELMAAGLDPRAIARRLGISVHTCRGYVKAVLAKLGAHSQLEAVAVARRRGLIQPSPGSTPA